ncbi:MAG TPA: sugar phosphate isomerase/epimerase family protein [Chitinophagaceae bacterium]|nr:sugar phosphate isomerase/epimerase family protein [Chitinophagaceae bacterium]
MSLNVRFGASTWLWTSPFKTGSIDEIFSKVSAMGFDAVEIAVEDPALIDITVLKGALEKFGLIPVICGAFGPSRDLTHEDELVHRNCFEYIEACFDICTAVGAKFLAGPMYSAVGKARMIPADQRKKEWNLAVKNIRKVCEMASVRGLTVALEPLNRFESDLINNVDDVLRLIKEVDHPAARIVLDGFHMNIEERDVVQAITKAGDYLIHMQVSENYRGTPGTGQTRWEDYRKGLELINYQGVVSIESFTPENQELAGAVCFWHPMAESQDAFATDGLKFLKTWAE